MNPALRSIFDEMLPFIQACADEVRKTPILEASTKKPPRFLASVCYPMTGSEHHRAAVPYTVWQAQRLLKVFAGFSAEDQLEIRTWLKSVGGEGLLALDLPPMRRVVLGAAHVAAADAD